MDDVHEYCNVSNWEAEVENTQSRFNLAVREFRRKRPWLRNNLNAYDYFNYQHPTDGAIVFCGLRQAPANGEQILFVANMEGAPRTLTPADLPIPNLTQGGWQVALTTPGLNAGGSHEPLTLADSQGVVFVKPA